MLTKKQNFLETIRGGNPDRYVNQFEAFAMIMANPYIRDNPAPRQPGMLNVVNAWGVTRSWPEGTPGPFPVHDEEHIVIKDIENWRDYVKEPNVIYPAEEWEPFVRETEKIDRSEYLATAYIVPGIFEQCHYLMEIANCLANLYEYPDEMHEVIDMITEWELRYAAEIFKYMKPDAVFHHDDWGSQTSTFMSPEMFREFFVPAYKKVYGYYKSQGAVIIHHSDSYAATLVPDMIDIGIDVWQGVMRSNDIPALLREYGGKISFMGGIDNADIDHHGWTREEVRAAARRAVKDGSRLWFIPSQTAGGPGSVFPGVYEALTEEIDEINRELFGI
ncbi:MAG: uroporphyrinogen decarboxylase [Clostridiales bacterium]|jgi:hypothetical protein|nr:uroporphyrinogen decarboxylase [Clostridiales bacterium]